MWPQRGHQYPSGNVEEVVLARLFRGKLSLKLDQTQGSLLHCDSSFLIIFPIVQHSCGAEPIIM